MLSVQGYDFIDFGSSLGGSLSFARQLGGVRGIGLDNNPVKVAKATKLKHKVICIDAVTVQLPAKCVNFCIMSHFLEHLQTEHAVQTVIFNAISASKDFLFIQGPYFDADTKLESLGLKFFWSDWHGHKVHVTSTLLRNIFAKLDVSYTLFGSDKITTSMSNCIHPLSSPVDSFEYNQKVYAKKSNILFDFPVYRELIGIVWIGKNVNRRKIISSKKRMVVLINKE